MDRTDLIVKLQQLDGTSEVVDALLDWFDTPRCEADWSTVNGIAGIIEKVAMGDMPRTILSDWFLYSEWVKARTVNVFDWKHFNVTDWMLSVVYAAIDARWCIQASAKSWPKDVRRADDRYDDNRIENPMMTWTSRLYDLVVIPELRKVVPSMNMDGQMKAARMLQFVRDNGEAIVECIMGYHIDLREWVSSVGIGMVPRQVYDRVKQVYDTTVNAKVQRDEFRENEWVHEDKCQRMRDRYAKNKLEKNWIG